MSEQVPAVSVIIPCYNLGQFLAEAVDSVLEQSYQNFEILVVDDGSTTPETRDVLDRFSRPKTTIFRTPNRGLAAARNYLIARARGAYLCALDADDKLHPDYLARTVSVLDRDRDLTFASTHLQMFGDEDRLWPNGDRCDLAALLVDDTVITAALVRRTAVLDVGGYDENMPAPGDEDWDLWISLVERGYGGIILPDVLFFYRRRRGSMVDQCTTGETHLALLEYIVNKHQLSYRTHLLDVLASKESLIGGLRRQIVALERDIVSNLKPALSRRRAELQALQARAAVIHQRFAIEQEHKSVPALRELLERQRNELQALQREYERAIAEVQALRRSGSWRVTQPLRASYDFLKRIGGR